jgi:hypothetical protein
MVIMNFIMNWKNMNFKAVRLNFDWMKIKYYVIKMSWNKIIIISSK